MFGILCCSCFSMQRIRISSILNFAFLSCFLQFQLLFVQWAPLFFDFSSHITNIVECKLCFMEAPFLRWDWTGFLFGFGLICGLMGSRGGLIWCAHRHRHTLSRTAAAFCFSACGAHSKRVGKKIKILFFFFDSIKLSICHFLFKGAMCKDSSRFQ